MKWLKGLIRGRRLRVLAFCVFMQAGGCSFDSEAFVSASVESLYNNISSSFIFLTLSDLLGVLPGFAF